MKELNDLDIPSPPSGILSDINFLDGKNGQSLHKNKDRSPIREQSPPKIKQSP